MSVKVAPTTQRTSLVRIDVLRAAKEWIAGKEHVQQVTVVLLEIADRHRRPSLKSFEICATPNNCLNMTNICYWPTCFPNQLFPSTGGDHSPRMRPSCVPNLPLDFSVIDWARCKLIENNVRRLGKAFITSVIRAEHFQNLEGP